MRQTEYTIVDNRRRSDSVTRYTVVDDNVIVEPVDREAEREAAAQAEASK